MIGFLLGLALILLVVFGKLSLGAALAIFGGYIVVSLLALASVAYFAFRNT